MLSSSDPHARMQAHAGTHAPHSAPLTRTREFHAPPTTPHPPARPGGTHTHHGHGFDGALPPLTTLTIVHAGSDESRVLIARAPVWAWVAVGGGMLGWWGGELTGRPDDISLGRYLRGVDGVWGGC